MTLQQDQIPNPRDLVAATLDWWRAAGVDYTFVEDPQVWLAEPEGQDDGPARPIPKRLAPEPDPTAVPAAPVRIGGDPANWPQELENFARWWLTEPSLDPAPPARRVPPSGSAQADLMVLVPMPEEGDAEILLSGRAGKLLDAMLSAMGLGRDQIYLASALPVRAPAPDWPELVRNGLPEVLRHHIALAAPKKLLILGKSVVSALAGNDPANNGLTFPPSEANGSPVPVGTGYDLEAMLARPALKAGVWKKWLEWTSANGGNNPVG